MHMFKYNLVAFLHALTAHSWSAMHNNECASMFMAYLCDIYVIIVTSC